MTPTVIAGLVLTGLGLVTTLYAQRLNRLQWVFVGKPAASLGFLLVALGSGAPESAYGVWVLTGLILSMSGDVFLMFEDRGLFLAGLFAFLLGHVGYIIAFLVLGVSASWSWVTAAATVVIASAVLRWLMPHVETAMRRPVLGYVFVISVMLALAFGTRGAGWTPLIVVGAALFYFSDLFVARDRFVSPAFANKLLGLPLYYAGQILLALSVAG